jgi:hypothetical protein
VVLQAIAGGLVRGVSAVGRGVAKGAKAVGRGVAKGAKAVGSGVKNVAKKNVNSSGYNSQYLPTARKNIGSPGYAAKAVTLAGVGAATAGTASFVTQKDYGFFLFILGLFKFVFDIGAQSFLASMVVATIFMFYSSIFIFNKKGIVTVSLFFAWYVWLGGTTDINTIRSVIGPLAIIGLLIHGVFNKFKQSGSFTDGVRDELSGAFFPVLLFFIDMGIVEFLSGTFGLTLSTGIQNLLNFTPWWAFLGLATTKKESGLITASKFLVIVYIIIIILGTVVPSAYGQFSGDQVSGPQALFQAKLDQNQQAKQKNPLLIQFECVPRINDYNKCIEEKTLLSKAEVACKNKGYTQKSPNWDECLAEEIENLKKPPVKGAVDSDRKEFLNIEFANIDRQRFPFYTTEPQKNYPATLMVENPNHQPLTLEIKCIFKKGTSEVAGKSIINGQDTASYATNRNRESIKILCRPESNLEGRYSFTVEASILNIVTESTLKRAFVKNDFDREQWEKEIKSTQFGFNAGVAKSPAEFARLNYAFGNFEADPIIVADQPVSFEVSVENIGKGQISRIQSYNFYSLQQQGFSVLSGDNCLQGGEQILTKATKTRHLASCFLELPNELKQFDSPFEVQTFTARLIYDYQLTQKSNIEVGKVTS